MSDPLDPLTQADSAAAARLSARHLFMAFSELSLSGFGGVMPFAYRALVDQRAWLSGAEFAAMVGVAQVLPGPTICNLAVMVGFKRGGAQGAIAALLGMVLAPMVVVLAIGSLYTHFGSAAPIQAALRGMSAVAAGLILSTAVKMGRAVFFGDQEASVAVRLCMLLWCVLAFIAVGLARFPLALVVLALAPAALATAWWARR